MLSSWRLLLRSAKETRTTLPYVESDKYHRLYSNTVSQPTLEPTWEDYLVFLTHRGTSWVNYRCNGNIVKKRQAMNEAGSGADPVGHHEPSPRSPVRPMCSRCGWTKRLVHRSCAKILETVGGKRVQMRVWPNGNAQEIWDRVSLLPKPNEHLCTT